MAACSPRSAPIDRPFSYAEPHEGTISEQIVALMCQGILIDGSAFASAQDRTAATSASLSVPLLPDGLAGRLAAASAGQGSGSALVALDAARSAAASAGLGPGDVDKFDPACIAASDPPFTITYSGCAMKLPVGDAEASVMLERWVSADGAGAVTWDLLETSSISLADSDSKTVYQLSGFLMFTGSTARGQARSDGHTIQSAGEAVVTMGWATLANLDVTLIASPFCVSGGTLEVKRIWTELAPRMPPGWPYTDGSFLFTWQGCGEITVARSL